MGIETHEGCVAASFFQFFSVVLALFLNETHLGGGNYIKCWGSAVLGDSQLISSFIPGRVRGGSRSSPFPRF